MAGILKILLPLLFLALCIVGFVVIHRRVERTRELRRKLKKLERAQSLMAIDMGHLYTMQAEVEEAVSVDVSWGSEELLRERIRTITEKCIRELSAAAKKRENEREFA